MTTVLLVKCELTSFLDLLIIIYSGFEEYLDELGKADPGSAGFLGI